MPTLTDIMPPDARHEDLILRLCAAPDLDHAGLYRQMGALQWRGLAQLAEANRLSPLLRRNLQLSDSWSLAPQDVRCDIDRDCQWYALYGLRQTVAIKRLCETLASAGFRPILLKGVALAQRDYPEPSLRPMRDVDLLLPAAEAEQAQAFLTAHENYRIAPWAGSYGIEYNHQLPELQDVEFELTIEIHHRINARGWRQEPLLVELLQAEASVLPILGTPALVPSARTNFLHLVEHATLHHTFDNGPATLADLHFLAMRNPLDWNWIERTADELGLTNSLRLVATVARLLGATWAPEHLANAADIPPEVIRAVHMAMLQDKDAAERKKLLRRLEAGERGHWGWSAAIARAFRPNPHQLAALAGSRPNEARRWLAYPAWLLDRAQRYRMALGSEDARQDARLEADMVTWLNRG